MKVILFGGTGMVGQGVLRECLRDPDVTEVLAVMRSATGQKHAKLRELVHADFSDFSSVPLDGDACFWCLGVSSTGMSEADYTRITHDYTVPLPRPRDPVRARMHPSFAPLYEKLWADLSREVDHRAEAA